MDESKNIYLHPIAESDADRVGAGLLGSLLLTRFLQTLLFEIKPTDPLTFGALTILLAGVALLASFIPARRASQIDPLIALRHE